MALAKEPPAVVAVLVVYPPVVLKDTKLPLTYVNLPVESDILLYKFKLLFHAKLLVTK